MVAAVSLLAIQSTYDKAPVEVALRTTTVRRSTVQTTVIGAGKLTPAAAVSVNFAAAGVLREVDVKPGDQVKTGQPLAKIDDTQTKAAVASAQAALIAAQENLAIAQQQAMPIQAAQNTVAAAQQQVAAAQSALDGAVQGAAVRAAGYQSSLNQVQGQLNDDLDQYRIDQATCWGATNQDIEAGAGTSCPSVLARDQSVIATDNDAVANATQAQIAGRRSDEQSIQEAQNGYRVAQDILASLLAADSKPPAAPTWAATAQGQVIQAQADLATAEKGEADTTLTAPTDGTIVTVNGAVGEPVGGGGTSAIVSGANASTDGSSFSASGPSSVFLTLVNDSALQVVVGFSGANANRLQVGQRALISLDPAPSQPVSGRVNAIDSTAAAAGNVLMRYVAVTLDDPPVTLKAGMPASVEVVTAVRDDVLAVPTADVQRAGGVSSVVLVRNGNQIPVEVTTGLVSDQFTEITSGLYAGEIIIDSANIAGPGGR